MLTTGFSTAVPELKSNQEEAETYFLLHTKHTCDAGKQNVVEVSQDTNVITLLLANLDLLNGQLLKKLNLKLPKIFRC